MNKLTWYLHHDDGVKDKQKFFLRVLLYPKDGCIVYFKDTNESPKELSGDDKN